MTDFPPLSPDDARDLLAQAERTDAAARAGASWTPVVILMSLGAASSLCLVALWLVDTAYLWLPMSLLFVWVGAGLVFHARFGRSVKRGFSRRWLITMGLWSALWVGGVLSLDTAWGDTWEFVAAASFALTGVTLAGAWREASR